MFFYFVLVITFQGDSNAPGGVVTLPDDAGSLGLGSVPDLVGTSPGIGGASKGKNNNRSELHDLQMAKSKKERTGTKELYPISILPKGKNSLLRMQDSRLGRHRECTEEHLKLKREQMPLIKLN